MCLFVRLRWLWFASETSCSFLFFLSASNEMEWHCVRDMSNAVLKSMPQSIQEPSLHYLLNWVSSLQLLSIQRLRNWVSSPKLCQHCGRMARERERERERVREEEKIQKSKWVYLRPPLHTSQPACMCVYFKCDTWESFLTAMSKTQRFFICPALVYSH